MKDVLIVGGGASGILVATHLARLAEGPLSVTIAEPRSTLGRGVAYGTIDDGHLLNVPAGRMSALPSDPAHFRDWAQCDESAFISRRRYGRYLLETFVQAQRDSQGATFRHERSSVSRIERRENRFLVTTEYGPLGKFDVVVLATGQGAANSVAGTDSLQRSVRFVADPWRDALPPIDGVLVSIGTGLTFIDIALSHLRRNDRNRVVGISRTGELPKQHLAKRAAALPVPDFARTSPSDLRSYIEGTDDWRAAQDGVRHELPEIWYAWTESQKAEFWDDHLRWWNVHRHRMAPEIFDELHHHLAKGRLELVASRSLVFTEDDQAIRVETGGEEISADLVVNSTGYGSLETTELFSSLLSSGLVSRGPLGMGVRSNFPSFEILDQNDDAIPGLFGIGPILLGERFETTAIPEIREQALQVARAIVTL